MSINNNNFIRWDGSFRQEIPNAYVTSATTYNLYANEDSINLNFWSSIVSDFGVDTNSFQVTDIIDPYGVLVELELPPYWNPDTQTLTTYRPKNLSVTIYSIRFKVYDYLGNDLTSLISFSLGIFVSPIITSWVIYPPSGVCELDISGNNNGRQAFSQLKLINQGTGSDIYPLTLKDNVISDADYIAPLTNLIACPLLSGTIDYAPLIIGNYSLLAANGVGNYIVITRILLACSSCASGSPRLISMDCSIFPNQNQRFLVPSGIWDIGLTIEYTLFGNMNTVTYPIYWRSQVNGAKDYFPTGSLPQVINTSPHGNNAITIPNTAEGITIYCS